ncbi:hypothetical protein KIN20_035488 [Parelaphostrongylus tenuis]|uniref:RRM domain-containing protein n=1 Tax=Parelaphostrongylus tenuis TaxID=148309 RepID=A0AAD5RBH3_PARTN|nr:hypothetical protein KIN20_035488 [Parelaphostrongylus tenuis]
MSRGGRTDNGNVRKRRSDRSRSRSPQKGDPKRIPGGRDGDRRSGANDRMVFITNLAYEVRWVELKDILREHGGEVVFVELLEDRNGHPKGNAIAEFKTKEGATNCIKNLDGFEIRKRKIITKLIRDPVAFLRKVQEETGIDYLAKCGGSWLSRGRGDDRPARTGSFDLFGLSPEFLRQHNIEPPLCDRVFIANLSFNVGTGRIYEIFGLAGNIVWMDLHMDKEGKSKGVCILQFSHPIEAVQAISMFHGQKLYDRVLVVKMDRYEKNEPPREGALPRGLEGIGAGLGANGAPLTDIASVVAGIRGDASVPVAPVAPVTAQPTQFPSFGMGSGVISGGTAFQSAPYSLTSHISNGQSFGGLGSGVGAFSSALGGFEARRDDSYNGADSRRDDAQFGMNFNVSRVVIIRNLPPDYTWQIVRDRVQQFGDAESVEMIAAGVARIRFALIQDAERMRGALTGTSVEGRTISVEYVH